MNDLEARYLRPGMTFALHDRPGLFTVERVQLAEILGGRTDWLRAGNVVVTTTDARLFEIHGMATVLVPQE